MVCRFPFKEDPRHSTQRPVIILDVETLEVLSVKVTKTEPRDDDEYDVPIIYWQEANLRFKSTARVAKTMLLDKSAFIFKIGTLHSDDLLEVQNTFVRYVSNA